MSTIVLVSPPRTVSGTTTSTITGVNHNYQEVFNLRPFLLRKNYDQNSNFSLITSEHFLVKQATNTSNLDYLTNLEFNQANMEVQNVARAFTNALVCTNAYVQTNNSSFSSQLASQFSRWAKISNGNFYPFFTTDAGNTKQAKIRNLAGNLQNFKYDEFEYCLSLAYVGSSGKVKIKALRSENYTDTYQDILNLSMTNTFNALESMGPYYANGYPDMMMDFSGRPFFLSIGSDAINLWEMNMLEQFTDMKLTTRPLVIQCDSSFTADTNKVNADSFFNGLFGNTLAGNAYPASIVINAPTPGSADADSTQSMLDLLTTVPYIVFADTMGYSYVPIGGTNASSTVGAIYTCTPYNAVSSSYTFTRMDSYIRDSGWLGGTNNTGTACYTEYAAAD